VARPDRPKQFLTLVGRESLFQQAYRRIVPLVGREHVLVVTGAGHAAWVRRQVPSIPAHRVLVEGVGRNTAASVALAAIWTQRRYGDAIMIVLPADHWIEPQAAFRTAIRVGVEAVRRTGRLVTIGVPARGPDPGFGYILPAEGRNVRDARNVRRFVEKPPAAEAERLFRSGRYFWNCGIFVWGASAILERLRRHQPTVVGPLQRWAARRLSQWRRVPGALLRRLPAEPIDRAVLERARDLLVVRARFRWSDLGTWSAVADLLGATRDRNGSIGELRAIDASGCLGVNAGGLTVFMGVRDLVTVREGRVVLVCRRSAAQRVKEVAWMLGHGGPRRTAETLP
jgi:mannose-1-phosphate guanylyltransferase